MLLLIMCRDLEVADRRMTTTIKLVLAHAFVSGTTALVPQLVRNGVLHCRPLPERSPSTPCLHLGSQLLLAQLVITDEQAAPVPARGFGTLGAQGTHVTHRSRKLGRLAGDHGDALTTWTGGVHTYKVQSESMFREQRPHLRPGACDNVYALCLPLGHPWAGHVPQIDIELQQAGGFLQLRGQQCDRLMLRLIGRTAHHLPDDFAIQIHGKMFFEAVEGFGAAFAAVAHVFICNRDAPVRRDVLLETSCARSTSRVWLRVLCDQLRDRLHDLLQRRLPSSRGPRLLPPPRASSPT